MSEIENSGFTVLLCGLSSDVLVTQGTMRLETLETIILLPPLSSLWCPSGKGTRQFSKSISKVRYKVERAFGSINRWFSSKQARCKGPPQKRK